MNEKPEMTIALSTSGEASTSFSICRSILSVRSCDVPGGRVTAPMIVPVSSFGTRVVGVLLIVKTSRAMESATKPIESHGRLTKCPTPFL